MDQIERKRRGREFSLPQRIECVELRRPTKRDPFFPNENAALERLPGPREYQLYFEHHGPRCGPFALPEAGCISRMLGWLGQTECNAKS